MKTHVSYDNSEEIINYPCLVIDKKEDLIVLMKTEGVGTVIYSGTTLSEGHYANHWDMRRFVKFNGSVKLSND